MRTQFLMAMSVALFAGSADADFGRWSVTVEDDPFDNKGRLSLTYLDSMNSGVVIMCEQDSNKITLRRASSFPYDQGSPPSKIVSFGVIIDARESHIGFAETGMLGTGNIGFDFERVDGSARRLLDELRDGKSKMYIKIGESDPIQVGLRGSTQAAKKALDYCLTE